MLFGNNKIPNNQTSNFSSYITSSDSLKILKMDNLIFRPAIKTDIPTLLQFEQGIIDAERPLNPTIKAEGVSYYDLDALIDRPDAEVVVGTIDDKIITSGYALIKPIPPLFTFDQYVHLGFMYVRPAHRGKGINRLLIKELTDWAKKQGVLEVRLEVYSGNAAAIRAYEKVGFKKLTVEMRLDLSE